MKRGPAPTRNRVPRRAALVLLVGFMGSGKTSVGETLARELGWTFLDLDRQIEAVSGHSIPELFRSAGEDEFRRQERRLLSEALAASSGNRVIALGGGTFAQPGVPEMARRAGAISVFLDAGVDELWERCCADLRARPLALDQNQFRQLYGARRRRYMKADLRVSSSGKTVRQVAESVRARLQGVWDGER